MIDDPQVLDGTITIGQEQGEGMRNVIAWSIVGDALGAGYEGRPAFNGPVEMIGGGFGDFAPYEWTDDTIMMLPLLEHGMDFEAVMDDWTDWYESGPADIGNRTLAVLSGNAGDTYSGGNGSVMRTAPVAFMGDSLDDVYRNATAVARLTHDLPEAVEATGLWAVLIRQAHDMGQPDIRQALSYVSRETKVRFVSGDPNNGTAIGAVSQAYRSILTWGWDNPLRTLEYIIRGGGDTDTVACIAGGLLGAMSTVAPPLDWMNQIHGYPGKTLGEVLRNVTHGTVL